MTALIILGWILCGVLGYGLTLGEFTREFPYMKHGGISAFIFLTGPFGIFVSLVSCLVHGNAPTMRFKPLDKETRWEIFNKTYEGYLSRERFERYHG